MYILIKAKKEIDFMDINDPINSIFLADLKSRERTIQSLILKIRRRLSTAPEGALRIIKSVKVFNTISGPRQAIRWEDIFREKTTTKQSSLLKKTTTQS